MARILASLLLFAACLAMSTPSAAQSVAGVATTESRWLGPDGPLPFATEEEVLEFLRTAKIVSKKELTGGVNRPLKVRLRQDGIEANAIFRIVNVRQKHAKLDGRLVADFHDSYIYECAAWEVSRVLGIDHVPPCVKRRYELNNGTMQLWVEGAMTETERRETGIEPPAQLDWIRQKQKMRLFDALIYNFDRNQGNMLIDKAWKLWFIDHTRSFKKSTFIERPEKIIWCEHGIFETLQGLDKKTLAKQLRGLVSGLQISQLLKRRDQLVDHLNARIARMGEDAVLYDASSQGEVTADMMELTADDDIPLTSSKLEDP